jgi:hypothetical protein
MERPTKNVVSELIGVVALGSVGVRAGGTAGVRRAGARRTEAAARLVVPVTDELATLIAAVTRLVALTDLAQASSAHTSNRPADGLSLGRHTPVVFS